MSRGKLLRVDCMLVCCHGVLSPQLDPQRTEDRGRSLHLTREEGGTVCWEASSRRALLRGEGGSKSGSSEGLCVRACVRAVVVGGQRRAVQSRAIKGKRDGGWRV